MVHFESEIKMGGIVLPVRSTYLRCQGQGLLFSPVKMNPEDIKKLKDLGGVDVIVAPTLFHHLYIRRTLEAFPKAQLLGVKGFKAKRPDLPWHAELDGSNWPFSDEILMVQMEGLPQVNEAVFLHKESKTLLVWDLLFNLRRPQGWAAPLLLRLLGTYNGPAVSRLLALFAKDKVAFRRSLKHLFELDFDRLVMAHGEILETNAKRISKEAFMRRGLA